MNTGPAYAAQIAGVRVCRSGHGTVHSVFASALNLSGDGAWLTLQSSGLPAVAHGVQALWPFRDLREHFSQGDAWRWEDDVLVIARRDGGRCRLSVLHAATWSSPIRMHVAHADSLAQRAPALWRACGRVAAGRSVFWSGTHAAPASLARHARRNLRLLRRARAAGDVETAVRALIGLGPGLTPAGDDALIGWLAGMALLRPNASRDRLAQVVQQVIVECLPRTSAVSRAHLEDALAGQFSQALSAFANALTETGATHDNVLPAFLDLAQVGASSGLDAAAGLLAALSMPRVANASTGD